MKHRLQARWNAFAQSTAGKRTLQGLRYALFAGIAAYLGLRLTDIGWQEILSELPTHPLFYGLFLALYFILPFTEALVYRLSWPLSLRASLPIFVKKRVYNKSVVEYSGEVFLYVWARSRVPMGERALFSLIKDNAILSSVASTSFAVVLLAAFVLLGDVQVLGLDPADGWLYLLGGVGGLAALIGLALLFRRRLFRMGGRTMAAAFALYFGRLVLMNVLQVAQWSLVLPEVGLDTWFVFLAALTVISRVPFLPAKDLLFLSAGVELSALAALPAASVAGMLLVTSAVDKLLNLVMFVSVSAWDRRRGTAPPVQPHEPVGA